MGRTLIMIGVIFIITGVLFQFKGKIPGLDFLGKLPGDLSFKTNAMQVHFPIVTCIVISVVMTVLFNLFKK